MRQPDVLTNDVLATIRSLREQHPFFGKVKIYALCVEQGLSISLSSVARALHYLMKRDIITPVTVLKGNNAADFLSFVSDQWPYTPTELQVDGGTEFRGPLENACKIKNIRLFVLPPRSPKLNGGVGPYNQTLQDEYFLPNYNSLPTQTDALNVKLQEWSNYYNQFRPHRSLIDKRGLPFSPCQFLKQSQSHMY